MRRVLHFYLNRMLRYFGALCVVLAIYLTADSSNESAESESTLPPQPVELDSGYVGDWSDWYGKWVVIAFYADWCVPCYEEVELLNDLHKQRARYQVVVLGMNFDNKRGEPLQLVKQKMNIEFPDLLVEPSARWGKKLPEFIPATYIINPSGHLHKILSGIQSKRSLLGAMK